MKKIYSNKKELSGLILGPTLLLWQYSLYLIFGGLAVLLKFEPWVPKIEFIDNIWPFVPILVIPYMLSYVYWAMGPVMVSRCEEEHYKDYLATFIIAVIIGTTILFLFPTQMNRIEEGLYELIPDDLIGKLVKFIYDMDGKEIATNLFPSFHCLQSTMAYLGVRGRKEVPKFYRIFSLCMSILIYAATLLLRQHYIIDVISGILLGVIVFTLSFW